MAIIDFEKQDVERKVSWRDDYLKWICGYANAQGGVLEIGKNDENEVEGLTNPKKLLEDIPNKIKNSMGIIADVDLHESGKRYYIRITVVPYYFPVSYHGRYYYRSGATMQELTGRALDEFVLGKMGKTWDSVPIPNVKFTDLDSESFKVFRQKAISSGRLTEADLAMSDIELLDSLRLVEGDRLKAGAVLLFHKDPDRHIPGAYVKIGYFENEADLVYQDEIHGSLVTITDKVMDVLYTKYLKGIIHYEGIQRVDRYPVAQESMREAILNAILHKDNMQYTPVQIKVFDDSVFIFNAGHLPDTWTVETLFEKHGSEPRNPLVAATIFRTGMIETWGRGIEKILAGCERIGAPNPLFKPIGKDMSVEFFAPDDAVYLRNTDKPERNTDKPEGNTDKPEKNTDKPEESADNAEKSADKPEESADNAKKSADKVPIDEREKAILDFIDMHGGIANKDAQELLGLGDSSIRKLFQKMTNSFQIEAIGDKKTRVYRRPPSL
jgi:ATP-dependent DNA helicase RecG